MKLKEIISCYPSFTFNGSRNTYEKVISDFESKANFLEADWQRSNKTFDKVIFKKGKSIALTFDYSKPDLEVQAVFKFDPDKNEIIVSVGNWGFPFEPLLSKKRYTEILEKIKGSIINPEIALA